VKWLVLTVVLFAGSAEGSDWLQIPVASYHTHRNGYNEQNLGLGYELTINEKWSVGAGFYRNSYRKDSMYAGATYYRWQIGQIRLGTSMGVVTGYGGVLPMIAPTATWEGDRVGVTVMVTPPVSGKALIALMMKWRLD
jgi:hypothetical protein